MSGMQIDADSREEYFAAVGDREAELRELDAFIRKHAPDLPPVLSKGMGAMLGYGEQPYQTKSMKEPIDWPILALAAQKRHISLYICASRTASTSPRSTPPSSATSAAARAASASPRPTRSTWMPWRRSWPTSTGGSSPVRSSTRSEPLSIPAGPVELPPAVQRMAHRDRLGRALTVWVNEVGGITFAFPDARQYVKWAPHHPEIDFVAEAERMRWATPYLCVPQVLEVGSDADGQWLRTAALPGTIGRRPALAASAANRRAGDRDRPAAAA